MKKEKYVPHFPAGVITALAVLAAVASIVAHSCRRGWRDLVSYLERIPGPLVGVLAVCVQTSLLACVGGKLAPAAESAILSEELVLCENLLPVGAAAISPVLGSVVKSTDTLACQGLEAGTKALLDKATAVASTGASAQAMSIQAKPLIRMRTGYALFIGNQMVGSCRDPILARLAHSQAVQAALLAAPVLPVVDAGSDH